MLFIYPHPHPCDWPFLFSQYIFFHVHACITLFSYAVIDRIFSALAKVLAILHLPFPTSFKQFVRITSLDQFLQSTRELIMCPKCKALFNEADCSAPHPSGRGCAPARCPVMLWGKRCDAELVTMTKVNGVYVCSAAMSQKFTHLGIVNQLRQALSRPEICAHLFDHLKVRLASLHMFFM